MFKNLRLLFFLFSISSVNAQTYTWNGSAAGVDGNGWENSANWTRTNLLTSPLPNATTPSPCGSVIIPTVTSGKYPSLTSEVDIKRLTFSGDGKLGFGTGGKILYNSTSALKFNPINLEDNVNIFGTAYDVQADVNASKTHQIRRSERTCAPIYRFEVKPGDNWSLDAGNEQLGLTKERSELKAEIKSSVTFANTIWISYSIFIEDGDDIDYGGNSAFTCIIGQWHHNTGGPAPPFDLSILKQGDIRVRGFVGNDISPSTIGSWTMSRGEWHQILIKAKFSTAKGQSALTIWVDKKSDPELNRADLTHNDAMNSGTPNLTDSPGYWKFGIYRTPNAKNIAVQYANMEVEFDGTSLESRRTTDLPVE